MGQWPPLRLSSGENQRSVLHYRGDLGYDGTAFTLQVGDVRLEWLAAALGLLCMRRQPVAKLLAAML